MDSAQPQGTDIGDATTPGTGDDVDEGPGDSGGLDACPDGCVDPCEGVVCSTPGTCQFGPGSCSAGNCIYPPALDGALCDDGNPCTTGDACSTGVCAGAPATCDLPPDAECLDSATLRVYASPGSCGAAGCSYATATVPCPSGCVDGVCVSELCAGVTCEAPPGPCYSPKGSCNDGQCAYAPLDGVACDDADPCTTGDVCDSGACAGQVTGCATPPSPECEDATTLRVWSKNGVCGVAGVCDYAPTSVLCPGGCLNAACVGDPCAGVACATPPSACYAAQGTCENGVCSYAPLSGLACDDGEACTGPDTCQAGTCYGVPVVCDAPPPAVCVGADTLRTFAATGSCGGGACDYAATDKTCANGCVDGACASNLCLGVVCDAPPGPCYAPAGVCSLGVCTYAYTNGAACDDGDACTTGDVCSAGVCAGQGAGCNTPPPPVCAAGVLTTYAAPGSCDPDEGCQYPTSQTLCPLGCDGAACKGDPCAGVACTTAPPPACANGTLETYAAAGTCAGGTCSYAKSATACAFGCASGACLAPPKVVIAELLYDAVGADLDVFVELKGPPGASLSGLVLVGINGDGGADYQPIALTGALGADGLYVVAHPSAAPWILGAADQLSSAVDYQNGPDSVALRYGGAVLDAVGYGDFAAAVFGGEGVSTVDPPAGQSLIRLADTNNNAVDFVASAAPSPGAPNVAACSAGQRFCAGACIDPLTSNTYCGASACEAAPCVGGATCVAGTCQLLCAPACTGGDVCVAGACQSACDDVCTLGQSTCDGSQKSTCVANAQGCAVWGAPTSCPAGQSCQLGACTSACADACVAGATRCDASLVQTCVIGAAGCTTWGAGAACPSGQVCTSGGVCGMVISANRELCGDVRVAGPVTIQGGAVVTCSSGALALRAREILVDPASRIDLSGTSTDASGKGWNQCSGNCNSNGITSGSSGGGNGTAGEAGTATKYSYKPIGDYCGGGGWSCASCPGGAAGGVRGTAHTLDGTAGGRGGDGCDGTTAVSGNCSAAQLRAGGLGGGSIRLVADVSVRILGSVVANGQDGTPGNAGSIRVGASGGAGGTIVIAAPSVTVTGSLQAGGGAGASGSSYEYYCGSLPNPGGAGGQGRIKIAHGKDPILTGALEGAVTSVSWLPPLRFYADGADDLPIYGTFSTLSVSWEAPYAQVAGYYYLLSTNPALVLTPQNAAFTTTPEVTLTPAQLPGGGAWYLHVLTVHEGGLVSTLQNSFKLQLITQPLQVSSSSHPSPTTWYPVAGQPAVTTSWVPPAGVPASAFSGYWVRMDRSTQPPALGAGWTWSTAAQSLLTSAADGPLAPGAYYVHVWAVDQAGNPAPQPTTRQVLLGAAPPLVSFYGYVTGSSGAGVAGVSVGLQPFGRTATTDVNGYFLVADVYQGTYTITLTKGEATTTQSLVVDGQTSPWTVAVPAL